MICNSFHSNEAVGHVQFYWRKLAGTFLKFLNHHIRDFSTDKLVDRGIGQGLDILVDYFFHGDNWVIKWFKKFIEKLDKCTDLKAKNC